MSTAPSDLIELPEAAEILGTDLVEINGLIKYGYLTRHYAGGVRMVSRQEVIDRRFRGEGLIPAAEWDGPNPAA